MVWDEDEDEVGMDEVNKFWEELNSRPYGVAPWLLNLCTTILNYCSMLIDSATNAVGGCWNSLSIVFDEVVRIILSVPWLSIKWFDLLVISSQLLWCGFLLVIMWQLLRTLWQREIPVLDVNGQAVVIQ